MKSGAELKIAFGKKIAGQIGICSRTSIFQQAASWNDRFGLRIQPIDATH
jgi:hypothetical protein